MTGYASELIDGLDWVLTRYKAQPEGSKTPSVVSLSLIISKTSSSAVLVGQKIEEMIDLGIIVVAAAGNFAEGVDAARCRAVMVLDHRAWWSALDRMQTAVTMFQRGFLA
jgi:aromatic ring-opening dioxygenase catalytic subunit (LigB family)